MKRVLIITVVIFAIAITLLGLYAFHQRNKANDLEADLRHLNNTIDIRVDKEINDAKRYVTDSLLKEFNSLPHDTIVKTKIKYRYEKITDTIILLPKLEQLDYITRELNRLYPDN